MPRKISEQTKAKASELKVQGKTYAEISQELNISVDWCKRNLQDVVKNSTVLLNKMIVKSKTNHGLAKGEIVSTLNLHEEQKDVAFNKLNNTVARIRRENKENIVRPDWMHPNMAEFVFKSIMQEALAAEDRINEQAHNLYLTMLNTCTTEEEKKLLPDTQKLKNAIASLVNSMCSRQDGGSTKLKNWTDSLANTSAKLSTKNKQHQPKEHNEDNLMDDEIYEDLEGFCY